MVKHIVQISPQADYEVQYRTLPLSEKPGLGKPLIAPIEILGGERVFHGVFDTERMIHGKVRLHKLRHDQAFDAKNVAGRVAVARQVDVDSIYAGQHSSATSGRALIDQHIKVAARVSHLLTKDSQIGAVPHGLRSFVIAQLLKDAKVDLKLLKDGAQTTKPSIDQLKARLAVRRFVRQLLGKRGGMEQIAGSKIYTPTTRVSRIVEGVPNRSMVVGSSKSSATDISQGFSRIPAEHLSDDFRGLYEVQKQPYGGKERRASKHSMDLRISEINSWHIVSHVNSTSKKHGFSAHSSKMAPKSASSSKMISKTSVPRALLGNAFSIHLKDTMGYGTAPIRYQQPMANGPPCQAFSLQNTQEGNQRETKQH